MQERQVLYKFYCMAPFKIKCQIHLEPAFIDTIQLTPEETVSRWIYGIQQDRKDLGHYSLCITRTVMQLLSYLISQTPKVLKQQIFGLSKLRQIARVNLVRLLLLRYNFSGEQDGFEGDRKRCRSIRDKQISIKS